MNKVRPPNLLPPGLRRRWYNHLLVVGVLMLLLSISVLWVFKLTYTPLSHPQANQIVTIPPKATVNQIYKQLQDLSILPDSSILRLWFKLKASRNTLKAGDYVFPSPITPAAVVGKLSRGDIYHQWITFREGQTRFEVVSLIQSLNISGADKALELTESPELVKLISDLDPQATTLEGYLFPDTYQYTNSTTANQLVTMMIKRFRQVFTPTHVTRAKELEMPVRQVVTLASMIELEAKLPSERQVISSVYHNRLRLGMKLDCDPTVIYASLLDGKWSGTIHRSDLERNSPYNTYLHPGLPPGPIASPGRASIEAALYPADTSYLYFVLDARRNDGAHLFTDKIKEHQAHVASYREAQRQRTKSERPTDP